MHRDPHFEMVDGPEVNFEASKKICDQFNRDFDRWARRRGLATWTMSQTIAASAKEALQKKAKQ